MQAGKLGQRVVIERLVQGQGPIGQPINEWVTLATVWAAVEPLNGREFFAADAAQSEVTTRIRMRYRDDITSADRIDHEGTLYDIQSIINPRSGDAELVLMCKAVGG
ncbi:phage head closure protein [Xenophilus azovorans]|uniref:phage head closure protein n=1 Tax=Xenophilus azovorans TaxID=151755 RepID=UPI00056E69AD|nr:phage head closure protein [Xenophilus azovorans]